MPANQSLQQTAARDCGFFEFNRSPSGPPPLSYIVSIDRCQQNCQQTALKKLARVVEEFA
jgi:hypothetical protein